MSGTGGQRYAPEFRAEMVGLVRAGPPDRLPTTLPPTECFTGRCGPGPGLRGGGGQAHLEIDGLVAAERLLDPAQALVGPDRLFGREFVVGHIAAEDVDPVESGL